MRYLVLVTKVIKSAETAKFFEDFFCIFSIQNSSLLLIFSVKFSLKNTVTAVLEVIT